MNRIINLSLFSAICIFCLMSLIGCSDDKNDTKKLEPINITETLTTDFDAKSIDFKFPANETWRVKSDADWCEPIRTQGSAGESITLVLNIKANNTGVDRTANVTIETISESSKFVGLTLTQTAKPIVITDDINGNAPDGMKSNANYLLKQIKVGWCLGNTCESGIWDGWSGDDLTIETNWGNPKTSKQLIDAVKGAGFNAIRIPVRWYVHADANMNINQPWLNRIKEIVDYAYSQGMYVVVNSHHDNWYDRLPVNYNETEIKEKFANMWSQIANHFKGYDEHLIFAGTNEMVYLDANGAENWGAPNDTHVRLLGELMQLFVETVRSTGGNNAWRCLMIQPWAANIDNAYHKDFKMPTDNVEHRLILEFHNYTWSYSTEASDDSKYFWGSPYSTYKPWYSNGEDQILAMYDRIKNTFIDKGVPVIMAEFGCVQHNKSNNEAVCDESRAYYHKFVVGEAKRRGIPAFYWDNGAFNGDGENFGLIDRSTNTVPARAKIALDGIMVATN